MSKIGNIFRFLKEFNEIKNPVVIDIKKQKQYTSLLGLPDIKEVWSVYNKLDFKNDKILEIVRPVISPCPPLPEELRGWINGNWKSIDVEEISFKETKINDGKTVEENFHDDPKRYKLFNEWITKRNKWRETELPKSKVLNFYNKLFKFYTDIRKEPESVELILGDGRLRWKIGDEYYDHPVFLQKVELMFDSSKPSFTIQMQEGSKLELYTPMLRKIPTVSHSLLNEIISEIDNNYYHIADKNNLEGLFKRLVNIIDKKGKFVKEFEKDYQGPQIKHEPILFLRKRVLGYSLFINKLTENIEDVSDNEIPYFLKNIIGEYTQDESHVVEDSWNQNGIEQNILFTLPANDEQLRIVKYFNNYGAVLVQGPPGTGKTHTIANLIGHLLSEGKKVLVTSYTEKALTVLKDKVHKDLQSLCISLLSSKSQRKEMEKSLIDIAERSSFFDPEDSKKKIKALEKEREELISDYKNKLKEIIQIRSLEYKDLIYDNETVKPIDAAKFIASGKGKIDYIKGQTTDDTIGLPLSIQEIEELYKLNGELTFEEEQLLMRDIPEIDNIWNEDKFFQNKKEIEQLEKDLSGWNPVADFASNIDKNLFENFFKKLNDLINELNSFDSIQLNVLNKTMLDTVFRNFMVKSLKEFEYFLEEHNKTKEVYLNNSIKIPDYLFSKDYLEAINEIVKSGREKPIGFFSFLFKPKWKRLQRDITINGKHPEFLKDFEMIKALIEHKFKKEEMHEKFNKLLTEVQNSNEATLEANKFEENLKILVYKLKIVTNWYEIKYKKFIEEIKPYCINKSVLEESMSFSSLDLVSSLRSKLLNLKKEFKKVQYEKLMTKYKNYLEFLEKYQHYGYPLKEMYLSALNKDEVNYGKYYRKYLTIYAKREKLERRKNLLNKLSRYAPQWAEDIKNREGIHGYPKLPENIKDAWKWRQLSNQLERLDKYDINKLQKELEKINNRLMDNAKKLACEKAWYFKFTNTTQEQIQAIEGWRQTIKQLGKVKGKSAPRLLKAARELMTKSQSAIPVWIMPLNKVVEFFEPNRNTFDVVIIDEASQADILSLAVVYLGKKVIIVGDDEQVSPSAIGIKEEDIAALIEQYLQDIPNKHLYNGKSSIYDIAKTAGFKPIMLTEHFRCLPEIIEFSNQLSYYGKIKPLRDNSTTPISPPTVEYRVNGIREGKINLEEARHIASLICACCNNPNYENKTFGIISMLGEQQAYEIDKLLQKYLDPTEYEKRKILCGTSAQFQGDERDIIFISLVDSPNINGGTVRLISEEGRNDMYKKMYNVAVSRAKDQLWVVHSLNPEIDLKPEDIRLKLINHVRNPNLTKHDALLEKAESEFEKSVMKSLLNRGYKVIPQWKVGGYRIDMVVEDGNKRVAIECDGDKYHNFENLEKDLERQLILERLGWRFIRIRGSAYYRNPEGTIDWVCNTLKKEYDIQPNYSFEEEGSSDEKNNDDELVEVIKRKAREIRAAWDREENDTKETAAKQLTSISNLKSNIKINANLSLSKNDSIKGSNGDDKGKIVLIKNVNKRARKEDKNNSEGYLFDFRKNDKEIHKHNSKPNKKAPESTKNKNRPLKNTSPLFDFRFKTNKKKPKHTAPFCQDKNEDVRKR